VDSVHLGPVLDTTAAGDTFIGYFLAARADGLAAEDCLRRAAVAAGICVTRRGARASIPRLDEVETTLQRMSFV
jgi:ribokinase